MKNIIIILVFLLVNISFAGMPPYLVEDEWQQKINEDVYYRMRKLKQSTTGFLQSDDIISGIIYAEDIINIPQADIYSGDVQGAINELARKRVKKAGDTMTGDLTVPNVNVTTVTFSDGTTQITAGGGGASVMWLYDINGDLMPSLTGYSLSDIWELDANADLMPK